MYFKLYSSFYSLPYHLFVASLTQMFHSPLINNSNNVSLAPLSTEFMSRNCAYVIFVVIGHILELTMLIALFFSCIVVIPLVAGKS